jgi:hypothetical protein
MSDREHVDRRQRVPREARFRRALGFTTLTVLAHTGFRTDVGEIEATEMTFDGVTATSVEVITRGAIYCSGESYSCVGVLTTCDTLVRGQAYYTFRGTPTIADGQIHNTGSRDVAGTCSSPEQQLLGWPER